MTIAKRAQGSRPRRYDEAAKADFRRELVQIAKDLFAKNGFESVSLRAIATEAGCTPMALYAYFPNKLALLRYIWEDIFRELFKQTEQAMAAEAAASDKLRSYWRHWVAYWLERPDCYRVVFLNQDVPSGPEAVPDAAMEGQFFANGELATQHLQVLGQVFAQGIETGEFRPLPIPVCLRLVSIQLLGIVHGLVTIPEFEWGDPAVLTEDALEACLRGFIRQPSGG